MTKTVLAIDPGSGKCGLALVMREQSGTLKLLWRSVTPRELVLDKVQEAYDVSPYSMVIVGNGTSSQKLIHEIREIMPSMAILAVDERDTSLQARERYWEHHPRRGWRRLLPATLQVPPDPVDDFVAYILAERVLSA